MSAHEERNIQYFMMMFWCETPHTNHALPNYDNTAGFSSLFGMFNESYNDANCLTNNVQTFMNGFA